MISCEQKPEYLEWANRVLDVEFDPNLTAWMTMLGANGEPVAVVVFNFFTTHNCEMSIATNGAKKWATKGFLRTCYRYAFVQLNLSRVTSVVEEDNADSIRLASKIGHVHEATLKCWFGEKDGIVMRMLRSECRWL